MALKSVITPNLKSITLEGKEALIGIAKTANITLHPESNYNQWKTIFRT